jgi:hypothetical protein
VVETKCSSCAQKWFEYRFFFRYNREGNRKEKTSMSNKISKYRDAVPGQEPVDDEAVRKAEKQLDLKKTRISVVLLVLLLVVECNLYLNGTLTYNHFASAAVCAVLAIAFLVGRYIRKYH